MRFASGSGSTFAAVMSLVALPVSAEIHSWDFDLTEGAGEWTPVFADLPADWETNPRQPEFELIAEHRALPAEMGDGSAWFLAGSNHSDDLLMYLYRQVSGLEPDTLYNLHFAVEYLADESQDTYGVGGSPGLSVWVKAGASPEEPERMVEDGYYRLPVDIGNQSGDGRQGGVVGTYGYEEPPAEGVWKPMRRARDTRRFSARSDADGDLWILLGLDSGFEATSEVFFTRFEVEARSGLWAAADHVDPSGWIHLPWLGWLYANDLQEGWAYHPEHAWVYARGEPEAIWLWSGELAWNWTTPEIYPWLYSTQRGWLRFVERSGDERLFEDANGQRIRIPLE